MGYKYYLKNRIFVPPGDINALSRYFLSGDFEGRCNKVVNGLEDTRK